MNPKPITAFNIQTVAQKSIIFCSDFHFGIPDEKESIERERRVCAWLDANKESTSHIFFLGDIFDTWMEYKRVIPRGNIRFLGKLAELSDLGIKMFFYPGNHDLWVSDFFPKELGIELIHNPVNLAINDKIVHIAHGDGVGPGDRKYKIMKAVLRNPICRFLYRQLHPDLGIRIASYFSRLGPKHKYEQIQFLGENKEFQILYAKELLSKYHIDYFVFGHRHIPNYIPLNENSTYINLGDWLIYNTYARFHENKLTLEEY